MPHVSDETAEIAFDLCERLGKVPVLIKKEVEGFLLNRIFRAINNEALWMLDMGIATGEHIDKACVIAAGHPMGPFRLMDLTGIDLNYTVHMERFRKTGNPADRPSASVVSKYVKGYHGQKTGQGVFLGLTWKFLEPHLIYPFESQDAPRLIGCGRVQTQFPGNLHHHAHLIRTGGGLVIPAGIK